MTNIAGSSGCAVAFLSISMRSNAAAPTAAETWGAMAARVWNTSTVTFSTRDGPTARMLAGNGVPSVIGTSPPSSPGSRTPITCSTPFTSFVSSAFPSTTIARARGSPSWATYSPGVRWMSSTSPARYSSAFSSSSEKSGIVASSSVVNMIASQPFPPAFPWPVNRGSGFACGVEICMQKWWTGQPSRHMGHPPQIRRARGRVDVSRS